MEYTYCFAQDKKVSEVLIKKWRNKFLFCGFSWFNTGLRIKCSSKGWANSLNLIVKKSTKEQPHKMFSFLQWKYYFTSAHKHSTLVNILTFHLLLVKLEVVGFYAAILYIYCIAFYAFIPIMSCDWSTRTPVEPTWKSDVLQIYCICITKLKSLIHNIVEY